MPEHADKKKRLSVYLDPDLMLLLADYADRREIRSLVARRPSPPTPPDADGGRRPLRPGGSIASTAASSGWNAISASPTAFAIFMRSADRDPPLPDAAQAAARRRVGNATTASSKPSAHFLGRTKLRQGGAEARGSVLAGPPLCSGSVRPVLIGPVPRRMDDAQDDDAPVRQWAAIRRR